VVNAVRAARVMFPGLPVGLHGESFGGGLAVIGAAMLEPHDPVWRLSAALPSLGAWRWRVKQKNAGGAGIQREALDYLRAHAAREAEVRERLCVCDAAIHARRVRCPSLFKLATRDDIVPAPSAAAVFNALGVDAGLKWRFVVRYGHFDGGLADLRRHAAFERLLARWFDPGEDVEALMHGVQRGGAEVAA
jgi:cephalosporin-C deacetylase-like acetyl esterase